MSADTEVGIPLIDFAPFLTNDAKEQQQIAQQIYHACRTVGFLYLKNHGISEEAIAQTFTQARSFFDLPMSEKQQVAWSSENSNRGYVGIERERLDESQPGDLKEAFNVGRELSSNTQDPTLMTNRWPAGHPMFQQRITRFFEECTIGAQRVLRAFAIALSLPPDALTKHHQNHGYTLRLLHYPPLRTSPKSGQIRAGAHSDYGSLTLLFLDQ
ncbi:MAG: 2-oxoglutarate and iron-dependent oxygenase domain-containing protein [Phormidesmis sp.]